jgi:hypothetical protein
MWRRIERGEVECLTHAVNVDTNEPVCKKVLRKHLIDGDDDEDITNDPPTCPACRKRLALLQ